MLGRRAAAIYLGGIAVCAVAMGLMLDAVLGAFGWHVVPTISSAHDHGFAAWRLVLGGIFLAAVVGLFLARALPRLKRKRPQPCPHCADEDVSSSSH
jgi:hypothetical protein